jgi:hypothetical protein
MSSQTPGAPTADPDRITFEVLRLTAGEAGRIELSGRWYGVRGRRFMRPALTMKVDGTAVRSLADLEHKPWAAQDGEPWVAAFPADVDLGRATEIELSVAPDIIVALEPPPVLAPDETGETAAAGAPRPDLAERARQMDRLTARLAAVDQALERERASRAGADQALERERTRRTDAEHALEAERTESLRLRAELGRVRAELDLAAAARAALSDSAASTQRAGPARRTDGPEASEGVAQERSSLARSPAPRHARPAEAQSAGPSGRPLPSPRADRPLNPSLRSRHRWLVRLVALLIMLGVIAAIVLVIRTNVTL